MPLFHLLRTAALHRDRGFEVAFAGLEEGAPFDLMLARNGVEAEVACDVLSAEEGRSVHRGAWFRLADRIDPDLQTWLAAHPGRYLLKLTLPHGLQGGLHEPPDQGDSLSALHGRIRTLLQEQRRTDQDAAVVLRLDPLLLAAAQADELRLMSSLRREFGPEAHLSVTAAGGGVFVMAARAGRENDVAVAVRRRMAAIAPTRLTGSRPGILAMFVDDTDRTEWRMLRERLELEGEARQFLTYSGSPVGGRRDLRLAGRAVRARRPDAAPTESSASAIPPIRPRKPRHSPPPCFPRCEGEAGPVRSNPPALKPLSPRHVVTLRYCSAESRSRGRRTPITPESSTKLDRLLNDPNVPMEPDRVWSLLAEIAQRDRAAMRSAGAG